MILVLLFTSCSQEKMPPIQDDMTHTETGISSQDKNAYIETLSNSPRHQEWVEISNNNKIIYNFVVYPEITQPTSVVILIHENKGLTDWVRSLADKIAAEWYIVIAPDLLSNFSPEKQKTTDFENDDAATKAINELDSNSVMSDLASIEKYAKTIPASNGRVVVAWFCWWWAQTYLFATKSPNLSASLVFYGTAPTDETLLKNINAPVYGFYGGNDNRVNATIDKTKEVMDKYNHYYEYQIYEGAWHAFMRLGEAADASIENINARDAAWTKLLTILKIVSTDTK